MVCVDRAGPGPRRTVLHGAVPLAAFVATVAWGERASATVWLEGRAGAGVTSGHYEFDKEYESAELGQTMKAHDVGGPFGIPIALGVVGGYGFGKQWALGLSARAELAPYIESINPRYSSLDMHLLAGVGPTLAYRPARSFELRVTPEWAFAKFTGSVDEIGAEDNVFEFEAMSGPGVGFSLGYASAPGWGFATAANVAVLSSEHQSLALLSFTLLVSWSSW